MSSSRIQRQSSDVPVEIFVSDQDASSPKQATKRSRYKCQECRRKRIKCVPELRDWEPGKYQKCDPCQRNGKACGRNVLASSSQTEFDLRHKSIGPNTAEQVPGKIGQFSAQPVTPANNGAFNPFGLSPPSDYGLPVNWIDQGHVGPMNTSPAAPAAMNLTFQLPQDEAATQSFPRLGELRNYYEILQDLLDAITPYKIPNDNSTGPINSLEMVLYGVECIYKQMLSGVVTATRNYEDHAAEIVLLKMLGAIHRFEQAAKKPGMFEDSTLKIHSTTLQRLISIYSSRNDNSEVEFLSRELINLPGLDISNSGIPEQRAQALQATSRRAGEILRDSITKPTIKDQLNIDGTDPFPAFHRAIRAGHPDVVRIFLGMPTTSNSTLDILGQHPLHIAAERGDIPALDIILLSDTSATAINSHDLLGRTPLCLAAFTGKLEIVKRLIDAEGDPRLRDGSARNSLHLACAGGRADVVHFLLNMGLSPNDDTAIRPPPLHTAAAAGFHEICRLLLDHGACTDDHDGKSAEEVALQSGHGEIAAMIKAAGKRPQNR